MKNLILISFLTILSICSYSQDKKFSFGLNGGTNLSIPYEKEIDFTSPGFNLKNSRINQPNFGYFAEAQIHYQVSEKIFTKWTIGYQFTQNKYEHGPEAFKEKGNFKMSGLYNSLSIDYYLTKTNIYIGAGLFNKYILTAEEKGEFVVKLLFQDANDPLIQDEIIRELANDIKRHEMGLFIEAGKIFKLGDKIKLNSFLRYNQSVVQILPDKFNMKHYSMYLSLGVGIVY